MPEHAGMYFHFKESYKKEKEWSEVNMMMAQGFSIVLLIFYMVLIFGSIAAAVFFIIAAWRAMRAHESIAESMKVIAEAQAKKVTKNTENKENA